jgi:hypothetical protein
MMAAKQGTLSPAQFDQLADVPVELEWLANITNEKTRRPYKRDVTEFSQYVGLRNSEEFRTVTRAHVIPWRDTLEALAFSAPTIQRKLPVSMIAGRRDQKTLRHSGFGTKVRSAGLASPFMTECQNETE